MELATIIALLKPLYEGASKGKQLLKNKDANTHIQKAVSLLSRGERAAMDLAADHLEEAQFHLTKTPPGLKKAIKLLSEQRAEFALDKAARLLLSPTTNVFVVRRLLLEASHVLAPDHPRLLQLREMLRNASEYEASERAKSRRKHKAAKKAAKKGKARRGYAKKAAPGRFRKSAAKKAAKSARKAAKRGGAKRAAKKGGAKRAAKRSR